MLTFAFEDSAAPSEAGRWQLVVSEDLQTGVRPEPISAIEFATTPETIATTP